MRTLCGGDPAAVTNLYAPSAVLLATFAPAPLEGRRAILSYMRDFVGGKPGLCGEFVGGPITYQPSRGVYIASGLYRFAWPANRNERAGRQLARYTFVFAREGPHAAPAIITHHSSVVPE